jgi:hypothetical protein
MDFVTSMTATSLGLLMARRIHAGQR